MVKRVKRGDFIEVQLPTAYAYLLDIGNYPHEPWRRFHIVAVLDNQGNKQLREIDALRCLPIRYFFVAYMPEVVRNTHFTIIGNAPVIVSQRVVYEPRLGEVGNQLVITAESLAV